MTATGRVWGILADVVGDMKRGRCDAGAVWLMAGSHAGTWFAETLQQGWPCMRDELLQVARYRKDEGDTVTLWRGPGWVRLAVSEMRDGRAEVLILAEVWRPVEVVR